MSKTYLDNEEYEHNHTRVAYNLKIQFNIDIPFHPEKQNARMNNEDNHNLKSSQITSIKTAVWYFTHVDSRLKLRMLTSYKLSHIFGPV